MKEEIIRKFKALEKGNLANIDVVSELNKILGDEDRGIVFSLANDEEKEIEELIELSLYNSVDELRILRNYLVLVISDSMESDQKRVISYGTYITIITSMIDNKIFGLGGEC